MHITGLSGLYGSSYTSRTSSIHAINSASSFWGCTSSRFCEVEVCFFNALRIASRLTGVSRTIFDFSSSSRMIHLECPSGTGPQASSMIRASARPSSTRLALSELTLRLRSIIIWHLHRIVLDVLFFRMTDFNSFNSSSVSLILYFFGLAIGYHHRLFYCTIKLQ